MLSLKICILKHQKRKDETYPVLISVYWQKSFGYIHTEYYVTEKQVKKRTYERAGKKVTSIELKDQFIETALLNRIAGYKKTKDEKLGIKIHSYSASELADYFEKETKQGTDPEIDFIEFSLAHCQSLIAKGKKKTASGLTTVINALIDYNGGRKHLPITEINARYLEKFCDFLQKPRKLKRINQFGRITETQSEGLSKIGVFDYMTAVRTLFNAARSEYNDEDRGEIRIKHYPFKKFFPDKPKEPDKRVVTIEQLRLIRNIKDEILADKRAILSRNVFMLSFYTAGMNLADLYSLQKNEYKKGRFSYHRQKTRDRRRDEALISIKVFPEVLPYLNIYEDKNGNNVFSFAEMYANHETFQQNVNHGLKKVAEKVNEQIKNDAASKGIKPDESLLLPKNLSTYYARFSFATFARNKCGISRDDIDLALNHVDKGLKMADRYIEKDWSLVDNVIEKVIMYLNSEIV